MDEDIKNNIIILALDNLISSYTIALEDNELAQNKEDIETLEHIIEGAKEILYEFNQKLNTPRPKWDKL